MKTFRNVFTVLLALHGLVHLMGVAAYLKLTKVPGLPYKTTVLEGRWDLGESGMQTFGVLWAFAAIGFLVAATMFYFDRHSSRNVLLAVTLFSLALTGLDSSVAMAGVIVNLVILLVLWLGSRSISARSPVGG